MVAAIAGVPSPVEGKSVVGMGFSLYRDSTGVAIGLGHNVILDDKRRYSLTLQAAGGMAGNEYGLAGGVGFNF